MQLALWPWPDLKKNNRLEAFLSFLRLPVEVAPQDNRCKKCGRSFTKIRAVNGVRAIVTFFCMVVLFLAFLTIVDRIGGDPVFPELSFINDNSILAAIVVLVLINLAAFETIKAEKKKYGSSGTMLCLACQDKVKVENEQAHLAKVAESEKWNAELKIITENDPVMANIVKDWSSANASAVPSRTDVTDFRTAINMERAGNFEGAAKIYEGHKLWTQAGKAREKTRMQTVKHVTVDMNQLIEQIGTKGLAVPYKCHNCGASITIDKNSSVSGLKFCSYCGTTYNIEDMSKIVQEALNY